MFGMALPWLLVLELVLYAGCFICGIISAASLTITQGHFAGQCILYGTIQCNESGGPLVLETTSNPSLCYFVSAISVCVAIYCLSLILFWIYTSCVYEDVERQVGHRERMWLNVTLGVCGVLLLFLAVSGCILRIGRDRLCLSALYNVHSINSCEEAQNKTWVGSYSGNQFYTGLYSAEKSVWVSFFLWLLIVAVVLVQRRQSSELGPQWGVSETAPFFHRRV